MKSYDYKFRKGIRKISWSRFAALSEKMAEILSQENIDIIIGIGRAGLIPATTVACMLRKELYPVRITRRVNDKIISETPTWKVTPPKDILSNNIIGIVDEIADTGETLSIVADYVYKLGAKRAVTFCLISHSWANPKPDFTIIETDELIIFPWDNRTYHNKKWQLHPELKEAIRLQTEN